MKQIFFLLFGCWLNPGYAQPKDGKLLVAQFDKIMSQQFKDNETGATVLVARNGEIIYHKAFGMANLELNTHMQHSHVFRIGSITKQFTAVAILQLMEQGKLSLQDEITKYIPDYPVSGYRITIEHLLTHTSGIANKTDMTGDMGRLDLKPEEMIGHFRNEPMKFAPGSNYAYSNNAYFLLGYIIEKITGKTYAAYLEENFFKPLGMNNSLYADDIKIVKNRAAGYTIGANGFENAQHLSMTQPYAAGSIQSTVADLFTWHHAVHSHKLIKKETLDKALTKYKMTDGKESAYGYGWRLGWIYGSPSVWHGGLINGFMSMEIYLPKEDVFVAVFSNCDRNSPEIVASRLAALAAGNPYEYKEVSIDNKLLQDYTGVYENQKGQQRIITVSENKLYSQIGRGPKGNLKAYEKDKFFFDPIVTIEFSRNKKGEIEKAVSKNISGNDTWSKTNNPLPDPNGIKVDEKILETYTGKYEMTPDFSFIISKEQGRLFLQATGQDKLEMFAETEIKFFLKVNDAVLEFVKDDRGVVTGVIVNQGGRETQAKKIK